MLHDNFPGFACWADLILSEFQNHSCAYSAHQGQKCESIFLFNSNMPVSLWDRECVIARGTNKFCVSIIDNLYVIVNDGRRRGET